MLVTWSDQDPVTEFMFRQYNTAYCSYTQWYSSHSRVIYRNCRVLGNGSCSTPGVLSPTLSRLCNLIFDRLPCCTTQCITSRTLHAALRDETPIIDLSWSCKTDRKVLVLQVLWVWYTTLFTLISWVTGIMFHWAASFLFQSWTFRHFLKHCSEESENLVMMQDGNQTNAGMWSPCLNLKSVRKYHV